MVVPYVRESDTDDAVCSFLEHALSVIGPRCNVGVCVIDTATNRSAGRGVHVECQMDAARCAELAQHAALYGTCDDDVSDLRMVALARLPSMLQPSRAPAAPAALQPHVAHLVAPFLPSTDLYGLQFVSPLFFADRDEAIHRTLCSRMFDLENPAACAATLRCTSWHQCLMALVSAKPKGSLRLHIDTCSPGDSRAPAALGMSGSTRPGEEGCEATTLIVSPGAVAGLQAAALYRTGSDASLGSSIGDLSSCADTPLSTLSATQSVSCFEGASPQGGGLCAPAVATSIDGAYTASLYALGGLVLVLVVPGSTEVACAIRLHMVAERVDAAPRGPVAQPKPKRAKTDPKEQHRIVVLGAGHVGKSAISVQYIQDTFVEDYDPNICDTYKKQDKVSGTSCLVEVVDLAGQEEYASLRVQYYNKSDGFLAVYDVTDTGSLAELRTQFADMLAQRGEDTVPAVVIGNKCDLKTDSDEWDGVPAVTGQQSARDHFGNAPFYEVSAKERVNIAEAFHALVQEIRIRKGLAERPVGGGAGGAGAAEEAPGAAAPVAAAECPMAASPLEEALGGAFLLPSPCDDPFLSRRPPQPPPRSSAAAPTMASAPAHPVAPVPAKTRQKTGKTKRKSRKKCVIM